MRPSTPSSCQSAVPPFISTHHFMLVWNHKYAGLTWSLQRVQTIDCCVCLFTEAFYLSFALSLWSRTIESNQREQKWCFRCSGWSLLNLTSGLKELRICSLFIWNPQRARVKRDTIKHHRNIIWFGFHRKAEAGSSVDVLLFSLTRIY